MRLVSIVPSLFQCIAISLASTKATPSRVVMCSISAFGTEGPLCDQPGYDAIAQAYGGVLHMNGEPDQGNIQFLQARARAAM